MREGRSERGREGRKEGERAGGRMGGRNEGWWEEGRLMAGGREGRRGR